MRDLTMAEREAEEVTGAGNLTGETLSISKL